jgi:hypothetical protein
MNAPDSGSLEALQHSSPTSKEWQSHHLWFVSSPSFKSPRQPLKALPQKSSTTTHLKPNFSFFFHISISNSFHTKSTRKAFPSPPSIHFLIRRSPAQKNPAQKSPKTNLFSTFPQCLIALNGSHTFETRWGNAASINIRQIAGW